MKISLRLIPMIGVEGDIDMSLADDLKAGAQALVDISVTVKDLSTSVDSGFDAIAAKLAELKQGASPEEVSEVQALLDTAKENIAESVTSIQETINKEGTALA